MVQNSLLVWKTYQLVAEPEPKIPWLKNLCVAVSTRILPDFALWNADFEPLLQHPRSNTI